jgi:hypothetical protein
MAAAILDRVLERGRFIHLDGPSGRTRHLNPEETLPENTKRLRIYGIGGSEFPEPTKGMARRQVVLVRRKHSNRLSTSSPLSSGRSIFQPIPMD